MIEARDGDGTLISRIVRRLVKVAPVGLLLLLATLLLAVVVEARPPLPFSPYGTVKVNDENVAEGTAVGAWCGGVQYAEAGSMVFEGDSVYFMDVPGDDSETPAKDGCVQGEVVTFTITIGQMVLDVEQDAEWAEGTDLELNLTAFQPQPTLDVEKWTNGQDADDPPGAFIGAGEMVTWTYQVTNTGNVPLTQVVVVDDQEGDVACPKATLAIEERMTCTLTGTATAGSYTNLVTVTGLYESTVFGDLPASDIDWSHYYNGFSVYLPLVVRSY